MDADAGLAIGVRRRLDGEPEGISRRASTDGQACDAARSLDCQAGRSGITPREAPC